MRVTDAAERELRIDGLLRLPPIMRDLLQPKKLSGPDVVQGALAAAELLTDARETCAQQYHSIGIVAFLDDNRLLFRPHTARLRQTFILARPIVVTPGRELDLLGDLRELFLGKFPEERRRPQIGSERPLAIDFVDVLAQLVVATHQVAQSLPANFQ